MSFIHHLLGHNLGCNAKMLSETLPTLASHRGSIRGARGRHVCICFVALMLCLWLPQTPISTLRLAKTMGTALQGDRRQGRQGHIHHEVTHSPPAPRGHSTALFKGPECDRIR